MIVLLVLLVNDNTLTFNKHPSLDIYLDVFSLFIHS